VGGGADERQRFNLKVRALYVDSGLKQFTLAIPHSPLSQRGPGRFTFETPDRNKSL
jgi:hypothetical protein